MIRYSIHMTRNTEFTGKVAQFLLFFTLVLYICYV